MKFKFIDDQRSLIKISGLDKCKLLQGLITNDINKLDTNPCIYTAMLTPQGKYLFDFIIYRVTDGLIIDINANQAADFIKKLSMYKLRSAVEISDVSDQLGVMLSNEPTEDSFPDPRCVQLGYRTLTPEPVAGHGQDLYESLRISLAIPTAGAELIQDKSIILECGLDEFHAIDWNKGCYIGQELMARTKHRGQIHKQLYCLTLSGSPCLPCPIMDGEIKVGTLTSRHNCLGIAMVRIEHANSTSLTADGHLVKVRRETQS